MDNTIIHRLLDILNKHVICLKGNDTFYYVFNKEIKDNFVRYTNEKELLIFTNPCLLKSKIVKTAEKEFSDCNKEKIVYANISDEFMNNDIFYKPYPTEILNHLIIIIGNFFMNDRNISSLKLTTAGWWATPTAARPTSTIPAPARRPSRLQLPFLNGVFSGMSNLAW